MTGVIRNGVNGSGPKWPGPMTSFAPSLFAPSPQSIFADL